MASAWAKLGIAIGGALLGGWILGPAIGALGMSVGFLAGSYLGNMIFPTDYETHMPPVQDYPVQTSSVGTPVPIVYGTGLLAGNIIWMSDLVAYQVEHKAEGGKGGGDEQVAYETRYRRSFLLAICEGPATILRAWKGKEQILLTTFTSYTGDNNSGISTLIGEDYSEYHNICCAYFQSYELGNSQAIPNFVFEVSTVIDDPADIEDHGTGDTTNADITHLHPEYWKGQVFTASITSTITKISVKMFKDVDAISGVLSISLMAVGGDGKPTGSPLASGTIAEPNIPEDPVYEFMEVTLTTPYQITQGTDYAIIVSLSSVFYNHYVRVSYPGTVFTNGYLIQSVDSGASWTIYNDYDMLFLLEGTQGGVEGGDANFASVIKDLLINERYGGYSTSDLITADFDDIIDYCAANNLKGSFILKDQKPLSDWISYICSHFQGYFYEIGGKIGLNCYRSQSSVLSIVQDDLVVENEEEPPVHITKRRYSSTFNRLECAWTDRSKDYKTAAVPAFDRVDQRESGQVRTKAMDLRGINNITLATKMAWRVFIDQIYRFSQYTFKLGYKSMLLEVGDVIDVTDGHLLTAQKMRVMSIEDAEDGRSMVVSAMEDISELYPDIAYSMQESEAAAEASITLTDGTIVFREGHIQNKLYLSIVPGGTQCNGWYVYRSYDDTSYDLVGKSAIGGITGGDANSTGTIQSALPAYTAVVHRRLESFTVNIGTLTDLDTSITDDDFFNYRKLAKIGNEIIAYKTCVETSTAGVWQVSNIIRGLFGTEPVAHSSGETFSTLDVNFGYSIQESDIGRTLYFKVISFYAKKIQLVSEVSSQSYTISGKYKKPLPVSLMRISGREGLTTYETPDVTIDWYFCSKTSGFGRGGYGNALWGAHVKDPLLERLKVELEEEDGTPITNDSYELDAYGEPAQLDILEADRNGKNPVVLKLSPMSNLLSDSRQITIEKV